VILCDSTCVRSEYPFSGQEKLYNSASRENKKTNREAHSTVCFSPISTSSALSLPSPYSSNSMSNAISPPDQTDAGSNQSIASQATTNYLDTRHSGPLRSQFQTIQDLRTSKGARAIGWATDRKISVTIGEPPTTTTPSTKSQVPKATSSGSQLEPDAIDQDRICSAPLASHQSGK